ncbi:MAG: DNA ligase D [Actinomycetota bacterium]|nr:DNA ligase D [Actinomycetota bacterium]
MRRLDEYEAKRDRERTSEPFGGTATARAEPIFVVQRHAARRLHYDFRLERDGALASWAVPKGIPLEPGARHLAVHVEDHPLEYATFEGEIPKGEYGAGTVEIWDRGTYELVEEKRDGGLTVRLDGRRLRGIWTLVPARLDGDPKNWLLIRKRDESGQAAGEQRVYGPMLATLADELPVGSDWLFEVKWDGYRALAYVRGGEVELRSRRNQNLTERFAGVAKELAKAVRTPYCVLDGEVCALDEEGRPRFSAMQQGKPDTVFVYYVFDVLEVEGEPLLGRPFVDRRARLSELLDPRNPFVRLSEAFEDGQALVEAGRAENVEGFVAKKASSRYEPGRRSQAWVKVKPNKPRQEFLIAGYTKGKGRRGRSFGSLVLAVRVGGDLVWVGNCGTGFTEEEIEHVLAKLRPLERADSPFPVPPRMPRVGRGDVAWVEPELVCEVEFAEWTHDGHLRAPSYQGLRVDKAPEEVRVERLAEHEIRRDGRALRLSNLDKLFWPAEGITKGDLLAYYEQIAPLLVPHLAERPFTMKRYPDGIAGEHFFQKNAPEHMPEWIRTVPVDVTTRERPRRTRTIEAPLVNDELALLWMVNMGCIDMNCWYSRVDKPDRPDFVLFDLDPSADVGFRETLQVARLVKDVLDLLGLEGCAKTSGAEGMHVLVPVERRYTYDETRRFAEIVAGALARSHRGLVTTEWTKAKRRGVLIDANQNGEGKTIASVYSVRARPGAPVSAPVRWDEVTGDFDPRDFTMEVVLGRAEREGDLFERVLRGRQSLGEALRKLQ